MLRFRPWCVALLFVALAGTLAAQERAARVATVAQTSATATDQTKQPNLADQLEPFVAVLNGSQTRFAVNANVVCPIDGKLQTVKMHLERFDDQSFDLELTHDDYAVILKRREHVTAFALPLHQVVFIGDGAVDADDHLAPGDITTRLISDASAAARFAPLVTNGKASSIALFLNRFLRLQFDIEQLHWESYGESATIAFRRTKHGFAAIEVAIEDVKVDIEFCLTTELSDAHQWPDCKSTPLSRSELERTLARGVHRATEVLAPGGQLKRPEETAKVVENGELRWIDGQRVVLLSGTPEQIGRAHGELLEQESQRCIDSVLHSFGTVQTIVNGRWFRQDLELAYARLKPHIPEDHKVEIHALAQSLGHQTELLEALNVFPELFHCSGFAVFDSATAGGKLYHGRVLDYMTTIGLQDASTTFVVAVDGKIPFANVGYASFTGSVSGMNAEAISLGEMGGRGEGKWDGVPMATLMRRALEECKTLDEVIALWTESPRTCEYYYVFADGKSNRAVGVSATPEAIQFVQPGEAHELLGEGIADAVVLSAGSRLETLRERVTEKHGKIDVATAQWLMSRPVAMSSNLHNVLFVPEDRLLYVANADHDHPAAERPYAKIELEKLFEERPFGVRRAIQEARAFPFPIDKAFVARDSLDIKSDNNDDAQECLDGLCWTAGEFNVQCVESKKRFRYDLLVRFPSPIKTESVTNDLVAMEWHFARNKQGEIVKAPAMIVVHESGKSMPVGRLIAKMLAYQQIHTFMIQLPGYGERRDREFDSDAARLINLTRQAVADVRRARDAVAALPLVDSTHIALQGTSLGGFVSSTAASLDGKFDSVHLLLAGSDLYEVIDNGERDAAKLRKKLHEAGLSGDKLKAVLAVVEPNRVAHRLDPKRTWLYSAINDQVVPLANAKELAATAKLPESRHVLMKADHYSGAVFLPAILAETRKSIQQIQDADLAESPTLQNVGK